MACSTRGKVILVSVLSDTFDAVRADYHSQCEILTLVPNHDFGSDLDFLPVRAGRLDQEPQSSGDVPGGPS